MVEGLEAQVRLGCRSSPITEGPGDGMEAEKVSFSPSLSTGFPPVMETEALPTEMSFFMEGDKAGHRVS